MLTKGKLVLLSNLTAFTLQFMFFCKYFLCTYIFSSVIKILEISLPKIMFTLILCCEIIYVSNSPMPSLPNFCHHHEQTLLYTNYKFKISCQIALLIHYLIKYNLKISFIRKSKYIYFFKPLFLEAKLKLCISFLYFV